jgi:hypothetical protein
MSLQKVKERTEIPQLDKSVSPKNKFVIRELV